MVARIARGRGRVRGLWIYIYEDANDVSDVVNSTLDATCMGKACGLGGGFDEFSEDDPGQCRVRCDCSDSKFHSPSGGTCHMYVREEGLRFQPPDFVDSSGFGWIG